MRLSAEGRLQGLQAVLRAGTGGVLDGVGQRCRGLSSVASFKEC